MGINLGEYKTNISKVKRVQVRKRMRLIESQGSYDSQVEAGLDKKVYSVIYKTTTGNELQYGEDPPIRVYFSSFERLKAVGGKIGFSLHKKALKKKSTENDHKIAVISDFFWANDLGQMRTLPQGAVGKGIGSGAFDLLLKQLHKEDVDFVVMTSLKLSRHLISKRGFSEHTYNTKKTHVLTKEGLAKQIQRIDEEDKNL